MMGGRMISDAKIAKLGLAAFCSLPLLTVILCWPVNGEPTAAQNFIRSQAPLVFIFEVLIIIGAILARLDLFSPLKSIPPLPKYLGLAWIIAVFFSIPFAPTASNLAAQATLSFLAHCLTILSFLAWMRRNKASARGIMSFLAVVFPIMVILVFAAQLFFVYFSGLDSDVEWGTSMPGFSNIRHIGYIMAPAIAMMTGMMYLHGKTQPSIHFGLVVIMALNVAGAIWLGSRGAVLAALVPIVMLLLFLPRARSIGFLKNLVLTLLLGVTLSQIVPHPQHQAFDAIERQRGKADGNLNDLSAGRMKIWKATTASIPDRPIIGHGMHQFRWTEPVARKLFNHPHNAILQFLYDWGLMGGGALCLLILYGAYLILTGLKSAADYKIPYICLWVSTCAFGMIDGVFFYPIPIILFLASSAIIFAKPIGDS